MKTEDVYPWCIENMKTFIRAQKEPKPNEPKMISAFEAASLLAIAFCKDKDRVLEDLLK